MATKHGEQARAEWAYETVSRLKAANDPKKQKDIKSSIRKLPSHIQTSGLAQTLLFYGKDKDDKIAQPLCEHLELKGNNVAAAVKDLVAETARLRLKTREAMAAAQWLKRFAEVLLEGGE